MNKNVVIIIDTSRSEAIRVGLETPSGKQIDFMQPESQVKSQEVLPMIEKFLKERRLILHDVTAIRINTGPGSYTGLRVGVAIANMLGMLLGVSVNGLPVGKTATPVYEGDRW